MEGRSPIEEAAVATALVRSGVTRGVTLIELLIVLSIVAILLGLSAGAFMGLQSGFEGDQAIERVKSLVRRARLFAVGEGCAARVVFDRAGNRVVGSGLRTVGLWHLEDETGAFDRPLSLTAASLAPDGRFGSGLALAPGAEAGAEARPADADPEGVAAELWVRPDEATGGTLLSLGASFKLGLEPGNVPFAEVDTTDGPLRAVAPKDAALFPARFARLGFLYDRESLRLAVNGVDVASETSQAPLRRDRAATLRIGSAGEAFSGVVDEVTIRSVSGREEVRLPRAVAIASAPPFLQFDPSGRLDSVFHAADVTVVFVLEPGGRRALDVSVLGAARVRDAAPGEGLEPKGATIP